LKTDPQQRIKDILSASPAILYACRVDGRHQLTFVSDNVTARFGYSVGECLDEPDFWRKVIHPDDHPHVFTGCDHLFRAGRQLHEYRLLKKNGDYVWVHDEMRLIRDASGEPVEIVGSWLDVTEHRQTDLSLSASENLFREFFQANPVPTIITSLDGMIHMVNPAFTEVAGYRAEDVIGRTSLELGFWLNLEDRERMVTAIQRDGYIDRLETHFFDKDNTRLTCLVSSRAIELEGELRILSIIVDVTEQKRIAAELGKSEKLFRDFFMANPVPAIISSPEGRILMINNAFTVNPGYTAEEVVGRTVQEMGFWRIPADRERMIEAVRAHGSIDNLESQFFGKGKRPMTCLISSRAIDFGGDKRILSTILDITEQRRAEEAMRKLEKAKSDFISTVAHELRTPLIAIVGYCELLENPDDLPISAGQKKEYLGVIQSNAEILNRLVDDLLDIGRMQVGRSLGISPGQNNLLTVAKKVAASFALKSGRHEIIVDSEEGVPESSLFDAGRIAQVLHNLLSNAIKYSPAGGIIKVRIMRRGQDIAVSVIDRGIGMSPEQVKCIFERFYRADNDGKGPVGLGLGLSIAKQIIVDHGGEILVESALGEGTTITFTLPVTG